jgi:hypothetical protein
MAKKKSEAKRTSSVAVAAPAIFKATPVADGNVAKGEPITEAQAVSERRAGRDVVVCGDDLAGNRDLAKRIENTANGSYKRCPPHANAGPMPCHIISPIHVHPTDILFTKRGTARPSEA